MIDLATLTPGCSPIEAPRVGMLVLKGLNALRARGVEVDLSYDFERFKHLFESTTEYPKVNVMFDPTLSDLGRHNSFWLEFKTADGARAGKPGEPAFNTAAGEPVGFHAGRVRQCVRQSVAQSFRDGSLFCDRVPEDWRCEIDAPSAETMHGLISWPGGLYLYKEHRKKGLTERIVPLTFALIRLIHGRTTLISTLEAEIAIKVGYWKYGLQHIEPLVRMTQYGRLLEIFFTYKTPEEHDRDLFMPEHAPGLGKAHL